MGGGGAISVSGVGVNCHGDSVEHDVDELGESLTSVAQITALTTLALTSVAIGVGCTQPSPDSQSGEPPMSITITSTAFQDGQPIPRKYTGDGPDKSPPLQWSEPPAETKSPALICDDPDAPHGTWVHWVLYGLSPVTRELNEGVPTTEKLVSSAMQGTNDFGNIGYGGPAPPKGNPHRYFFKLYALSEELDLAPGATKAELLDAMKGKIVAEGQLMGTYQR